MVPIHLATGSRVVSRDRHSSLFSPCHLFHYVTRSSLFIDALRDLMIRVVHVISDLDTGGAEVMLTKLVSSMDRSRFANAVVALTDRGQLSAAIESAGVAVHSLGMKRGRPGLSGLPTLVRLLRSMKPHLVQSWLYHADFLSVLAARFAGSPPVVWNVRCSDMDLRHYPRQTRWVLRALTWLSSRPAAVVVNSLAGRTLHRQLGYRARRWEIIPNGFDLLRFRPDPAAGQRLRAELRLPTDSVLVALVARVDPMKDHPTFLAAAGRVAVARAAVHFLLIGKDTPMLQPLVLERGVAGRVHLLGQRHDVDRLLPGVDIACLSSAFGEGFPNVLGEAMAAAVPCVATDVGDARALIGDTGNVVPPRDPKALAAAVIELIDQGPAGRAALGQAARSRIQTKYSLPSVVERYQQLYEEMARRAA